MFRAKLVLSVLAMLLVGATNAQAALVSTGTAGVGALETNWSVAAIVPLTANPLVLYGVSGAAAYPGAWVPAPTGSNWISPYVDAATTSLAVDDPNSKTALADGACGPNFQNGGGACYQYTNLAFNDPGSAITVQWASDNGANFYLNGTLVSTIPAPSINDTPFASLTTFALSGFLPTGNLITVDVTNLKYDPNNPTGLLVSLAPVPLPAALPLFASGLGGFGVMGWWRRRRHARANK